VPPLAVVNPRWSPDGKLIAFTDLSNGDRRQMIEGSLDRIYIISADGGGPELLLAGNFLDPTWSPDGNSLAYSSQSDVRILELQTQKSTAVPGSQGLWSPRWSPDGKYLVALSPSPPRSSKWEELVSGERFGWPSWSRDSKFVYAQDNDSLLASPSRTIRRSKLRRCKAFGLQLITWTSGTSAGLE
jgi:eukaryotic-like serine/threonine-protein kinase